jgi:hypothetical protein
MTYPILLQSIVIDATNKVINFREGANTATATLVEATYYLRGNGAADDFCLALKTALETNNGLRTSTNTYSVVPAWSADPSARGCIVTITRLTGADSFQFLAASTTFDQGLIGFDFAADTLTAGPKSSTTSPSSAWVGDGPHRLHDPVDRPLGYAKRAQSGRVRRAKTGTTRKDRRCGVSFVSPLRTHEMFVAGVDVERCFNRFLDRWRAGKPCELHLSDITAGFALGALSTTPLSTATRQGVAWQLGGDGNEEFEPRRQSNAVALFSWDLDLWEHVA